MRKHPNSFIKPSEFVVSGGWSRPTRPDSHQIDPRLPIRIRSANSYTNCWETKFVSKKFVIRIFNSSIRNSSQPNFVYEFAIRLYEIRLRDQFVYTKFVSKPIRLYEFRLQTISSIRISSQGGRNGPETNSVYEFRIRNRHLGTEFVYEIRLHFHFVNEIS